MKPRLLLPLMLILCLAGSGIAFGQDRNEKKIDRLQRKIEKQTKKLQELTGEEFHADWQIPPPINEEEIEKIKEEARAQAEEAREQARESMEMQREAIRDQKRAMEEKMIVIREKNAEKMAQKKEMELDKLDELKDVEVDILKDFNGKKYHYYYKTPNWKSNEGGVTVFGDTGEVKVDIPEFKGGVYSIFSGDQDNLSINKNLIDESGTADFNYEVKEGASGVSVNVKGEIEAGKVKIVIKKPDGEIYNEYTLSPLANVNWKQSIKFEDQEESEYIGKWVVTVVADKAKGAYTVQINGR